MDFGSVISILVAIVATIISLVSLQRTRMFNERQLQFLTENEKLIQLQRQMIEHEERERVASDVSIFIYDASNGKRLGIVNSGKVLVENVALKYMHQAGYDSPFIESEISEKLPIKQMHPGEENSIILTLHDQTPMSFEVQLNWSANGGHKYEKRKTVTP